jgi:hypothetical protein
MKYDYYGNYDKNNNESNTDTFSYSIHEIHKKQREKEKMRIKIYEKIASKCFAKIKDTANNEITYCFFQMPEYIPGYPIYNMTECIMYLIDLLHEKGFKARYCDKFMIFISWNFPKANYKMIENDNSGFNNPAIENSSVIKDLNLKYKPIENHQSFSFIPRKKGL